MLVKHLSQTTLKIHMYARSPFEAFLPWKGSLGVKVSWTLPFVLKNPETESRGMRITSPPPHSFQTGCSGLWRSRDHTPFYRQIGLPKRLLVSAASETLCLIAVSGGENVFHRWEITSAEMLFLLFLPPLCKTHVAPEHWLWETQPEVNTCHVHFFTWAH